jgi:hypothetical protein
LVVIRQGDDPEAADFARLVAKTGSYPFDLGPRRHHFPDSSFGHDDADNPTVVIEVSHSQKRKDLPFLADDYILGSNGSIQVVIGIDLEYRENKGQEAKVLLWRPAHVEQDGVVKLAAAQKFEKIFRAADGSLVNGDQTLSLQLKDFGDKAAYPRIDNLPREITISFEELHSFVERGEKKRNRAKTRGRSQLNALPHKERARSPPEQLRSPDEKRFQRLEDTNRATP